MIESLVTGGAGYFGDLLTRKLLERGYFVRILDIHRPSENYPDTEVVQVDIRDTSAVRSACDGIDVVFHNAAEIALTKNESLLWTVNRDGTRNLLGHARTAQSKKWSSPH